MNFSDNDLLTIITVADCQSISSASTLLYTTRQNVSKTIAKVEKKLNIELFQRMHDGVYLTEKGKLFYDYAIGVRDLQDNLMRQLYPQKYTQPELQGKVQIITIPHLMNSLIPFVRQFSTLYPNIDINIIEMSPDIFTTNLENNTFTNADLFLFAQNGNNDNDDMFQNETYRFHLLGKQPFVLYANVNSHIAELDKISVHALKNLNLVVYSPSTELNFMAFSRDAIFKDIKANIKFHSNNLDVCKNYVLQNKAFLLGNMNTFDFSTDANSIVKIPFKENLYSHIYLATFNQELSPHIAKLVEAFLTEYEKQT